MHVTPSSTRHVLANALTIEVLLRGVNIGVHLTRFRVQYCFTLSSHRTKEYTSNEWHLNPTPGIYNDTLAYLKADFVNDANKNGQCYGKNYGCLIERSIYASVNLTFIGLDNGLLPVRDQAMIRTNVGSFVYCLLRNNFQGKLIELSYVYVVNSLRPSDAYMRH